MSLLRHLSTKHPFMNTRDSTPLINHQFKIESEVAGSIGQSTIQLLLEVLAFGNASGLKKGLIVFELIQTFYKKNTIFFFWFNISQDFVWLMCSPNVTDVGLFTHFEIVKFLTPFLGFGLNIETPLLQAQTLEESPRPTKENTITSTWDN